MLSINYSQRTIDWHIVQNQSFAREEAKELTIEHMVTEKQRFFVRFYNDYLCMYIWLVQNKVKKFLNRLLKFLWFYALTLKMDFRDTCCQLTATIFERALRIFLWTKEQCSIFQCLSFSKSDTYIWIYNFYDTHKGYTVLYCNLNN